HNIVAWRKLAEICGEWLKKGQKVYIEGSIRNRSYDDKNGVKRYVTEIIADDLIMLGGGKGVVDTELESKSIQATLPNAEEKEDDLPF
ncbi:MAG: single-stranded DNA-binding protein, partial [Bacteroidota bacterium]